MLVVCHHEDHLHALGAKCCLANRMDAMCKYTSYITHSEFMHQKLMVRILVMLNASCLTTNGAAVFVVSGRTQSCFVGHLQPPLNQPDPKNTKKSRAGQV